MEWALELNIKDTWEAAEDCKGNLKEKKALLTDMICKLEKMSEKKFPTQLADKVARYMSVGEFAKFEADTFYLLEDILESLRDLQWHYADKEDADEEEFNDWFNYCMTEVYDWADRKFALRKFSVCWIRTF